MDWLTELCRVLAYIVLERYGKSVSFARTLDITPPSGELVKAIVIVKFSLPARVDKKQSVSVSRLPIVEPAYNVSGDPGTTVTAGSLAAAQDVMTNGNGTIPVQMTDAVDENSTGGKTLGSNGLFVSTWKAQTKP